MTSNLTHREAEFKKTTLLFCDGACSGNPGTGGYGTIVRFENGQILELGGSKKLTTNNEMELLGALVGIESILENRSSGTVNVFSDSVYFLRGISQWVHGWKKRGWLTAEGQPVANKEIWQQLIAVVDPIRKRFVWNFVRGHVGIPGNERCDEIAVGYSKRDSVELYEGDENNYSHELFLLPQDLSIPEIKSPSEPKVAFSYLSYVGSEVIRHKTWSECEQRVKGRSGAKFKKAMSPEDESKILTSWGLKPDHPIK
jgi:ribonuclease HI